MNFIYMDFITGVVLAAAALTFITFVAGVSAMASNGKVAHHSSGEWMIARVGAQGLTLFLLWLWQYT